MAGQKAMPPFGEIREIVDRIQAGLGEHYNSADLVFGNVGSFSSFRYLFSETIRRSGVDCTGL